MNTQGLLALAQLILPSEILSNFEVVRVEEESSLIRIYLDESVRAEYKENPKIESKGFCGLTRQTRESRLNAFALSELVGRKWGGILGKSSKESLFCAFWQRYSWGIEGIFLLKRCNNSQKVLSLQPL